MQQQRRQAELVHQMRLVTVAKIADVLVMGQVGLGQQNRARGDVIHHQSHQLDNLMSLGQVNAGGADLLPQIGNGIQAHNPSTVGNIP